MVEQTRHLNTVLRSLRSVNRVITQEKKRDRLIKEICNALVQTRGYKSAWIALCDASGRIIMTAEAGLGGDFLPLSKKLKKGIYPTCVKLALKSSDIVIIRNPFLDCEDCPLSSDYQGRKGMSVRLEYEGECYGVLNVSTSPDISLDDREEQSLYKEIAQDISLALYNIQLSQERLRAMEEMELLSKFPSENPYPVMRIDKEGIIKYANPASSLLLKTWNCRVGQRLPDECHRFATDNPDSGIGWETEITCGDHLLHLTFTPVKEAGYINIYGIDITERQKAKEAEDLKKLTELLIDFQEEERRLVSRELHDQIGQILAAVKLQLKMIPYDHPDLAESVVAEMDKVIGLLNRAQEDTRRLSARLRPDILDDFGLSAAIENEVKTLSEFSRINIIFIPRAIPNRIEPRKEVVLYRVAQEALTNIIRHAGASEATVQIEETSEKIVLRIADNGKGFSLDDNQFVSLGILGMKERLNSVGGLLLIKNNPTGGTILEAEIPLP